MIKKFIKRLKNNLKIKKLKYFITLIIQNKKKSDITVSAIPGMAG